MDGNTQSGQHSAHYALAALRAEVNQLASKAFCTAAATEAAGRAHLCRVHDLAKLQAALLGARRTIGVLDNEIAVLNNTVHQLEAETKKQQNCIEEAQQVFQALCSTVEYKIYSFLHRLGFKI